MLKLTSGLCINVSDLLMLLERAECRELRSALKCSKSAHNWGLTVICSLQEGHMRKHAR